VHLYTLSDLLATFSCNSHLTGTFLSISLVLINVSNLTASPEILSDETLWSTRAGCQYRLGASAMEDRSHRCVFLLFFLLSPSLCPLAAVVLMR
jgi:hypothetical protein